VWIAWFFVMQFPGKLGAFDRRFGGPGAFVAHIDLSRWGALMSLCWRSRTSASCCAAFFFSLWFALEVIKVSYPCRWYYHQRVFGGDTFIIYPLIVECSAVRDVVLFANLRGLTHVIMERLSRGGEPLEILPQFLFNCGSFIVWNWRASYLFYFF
jgi:hypothetical protein